MRILPLGGESKVPLHKKGILMLKVTGLLGGEKFIPVVDQL